MALVFLQGDPQRLALNKPISFIFIGHLVFCTVLLSTISVFEIWLFLACSSMFQYVDQVEYCEQ